MRLAIADVQPSIRSREDAMRARELALQRLVFRSISPFARSEHRRDNSAPIDLPNRVVLGIGNVDIPAGRPCNTLRAVELRLFGWSAIAGVAFIARAGNVMDPLGRRIDSIHRVAFP